MEIKTEVLLAGIKEYAGYEEIKSKIDGITGASGILTKVVRGVALVPYIVAIVEGVYNDVAEVKTGGGNEKRKAVIKFIDDIIDAPWWIESFDDNLIGIAVDAIVGVFNIVKGKEWIEKVKEFLGIE